jgi:hypothetical protein
VSPGAYTRVDGTVVAASWTELTSGTLTNGVTLDENFNAVSSGEVWTGTLASGNGSGGCVDFTDVSFSAPYAYVGISDLADARWSAVYVQICDRVAHLYCFEQ